MKKIQMISEGSITLNSLFVIMALMVFSFKSQAQRVVFNDLFIGVNGELATNSTTYNSNLPNIETNPSGSAGLNNNELRISPGAPLSPEVAIPNIGYVSGSTNAFGSFYKTRLDENAGLITWYGGMMYNRAGQLSTSFAVGNYAACIVLACDKADPTDSTAKGYGLFLMRPVTGKRAVYLKYFSTGINGVTNSGFIIRSSNVDDASNLCFRTKTTYDPATNEWSLSVVTTSNLTSSVTYPSVTSVSNTDGTTIALPYFGFSSAYATTSSTFSRFDNFKIEIDGEIPLIGGPFTSSYITVNPDSTITYAADSLGNTIPDFSRVGYHHGFKEIPDVTVVKTVDTLSGDAGATLQAAINEVAAMQPDAQDIRGTILIKKGTYYINGSLNINTSGIILRGEGDNAEGTRLVATGTSDRSLIYINGSGSITEIPNTRVQITDTYVPCGAKSFNVSSVTGYKIGDPIILYRPATTNWIHDIKMDNIAPGEGTIQWSPSNYNLFYERQITAIHGNRIYIDNPVVMAIDEQYGGGEIYKYSYTGRLKEVGIENILFESEYASETDENHSWIALEFDRIENGWVRNVTSHYFANSCVSLRSGAKNITVKDSKCFDAKSLITGSRRYSFHNAGQQNLFMNLESREGRHDYVTGGKNSAGPNVFYNCKATNTYSDIGPHQRWATGTLYDNIETDGQINVQDRGNYGTGHGWAGANEVIWNSKGESSIVQSPWISAKNYNIGFQGMKKPGRFPDRSDGEWEGLNHTGLQPASLFLAQRLSATLDVPTQTAVFTDDFTGTNGTLITGAVPSITYSSNVPTGTSNAAGSAAINSNRLRFYKNTASNLAYVSGSSSVFLSPYHTTLALNTQTITWNVNMMYNRSSILASSMSSGNPACAAVLACDHADPTASGTKGYGVFYLRNGSFNALYLIYFSNGINGVTNSGSVNQRIIAKSSNLNADASNQYLAVKVTYVPSTNMWQLSHRADAGIFTDPMTGSFRDTEAEVDSIGTAVDMPYFSFASSYSASSGNSFFDSFTVTVDNTPIVQEDTLMMKLTNFTAKKSIGKVQLSWQTVLEQDSSRFDVLRSTDGVNFLLINKIKGIGISDRINRYNYLDVSPLQGTVYYRLRQVNFNGDSELSNIVAINTLFSKSHLQAYVTAEGQIVVSYLAKDTSQGTVAVYDVLGKKIANQSIQLQAGDNLIYIPSNITKGIYMIILTDGKKQSSTKVLKE